MSPVKFTSECFIRPEREVDESKRIRFLRPKDLSLLSLDQMHLGQVFRKRDSCSISSFLDKLKHSLSFALVHFYPLAGQLVTKRFEHEHSCCIFIDCSKGPGARLIQATALDLAISDVYSPNIDVPLVVRSFFDLGERAVNHDGHTRPLLTVQVTELVDGLVLGVSINHCVVDGISADHFFSMWSELSQGSFSSISRVPIFDYELPVPDGYDQIMKLPYLEPQEFIRRVDVGLLRERVFHVSRKSMVTLKAKAIFESKSFTVGGSAHATPNVSSFQALSALVWKSITRARHPPSDERTSCAMAVNLRSRLDPPLSPNCVGYIVGKAWASAQVGELLTNNLGWSALQLHQAVVAYDDKVARRDLMQAFTDGPQIRLSGMGSQPNPVAVNGSYQMNMYGHQFGLGRAVATASGATNKADGKVYALMGSQGLGSVELHVSLAPHTMDALLLDDELMTFVSLDSENLSMLQKSNL